MILAGDMLMGWGIVFSMPVGALAFRLVGIFGNHEIVNAIMVGAFSLGLLIMLNKVKKGKK